MLDRFAKVGDLRPFVAKEEVEKLGEAALVPYRATEHQLAILDEDSLAGILEDDVVLRIAGPELLLDFLVEVVVLVLRLPIAERHAQRMDEGAIHANRLLPVRQNLVFRQKDQVLLPRVALQKILERLAHDALGRDPRNTAQTVQFGQIFADELAAHDRLAR